MELYRLTDFDSQASSQVSNFLLKNESKCVSLLDRFFKRDSEIFYIKNSDGNLIAVLSYSKGGQLLHMICFPEKSSQKLQLEKIILKVFSENVFPRLFSILGLKSGSDFLNDCAKKAAGKNFIHTQEYDLLLSSAETTFSKTDAEFLCCNENHFESLYPLQKNYELEEVVFDSSTFNEAASRILFKKNLEHKNVFALYVDGIPVSKASVNGKSKNFVQIGGVFTDTEFRKKGYAKILINNLCCYEFETAKKLVLFVKKTNLAAKKLYESCGFHKTDDYRIFYY